MEEKQGCLIDTLEVLKISSKEAVENLEEFSPFKNYMHVERNVQRELIKLLTNVQNINKSQLILVCGSVGDGKSHLLSYLKQYYGALLKDFMLYNDASESFNPEDSDIDTLNRELEAFSDDQLENGTIHKIIIAINLGTLSNFIESSDNSRYSKLREFVYGHKILDNEVVDYTVNVASTFQFINFSDYHMYTLTKEGPKSDYIKELLNKVVNRNNENVFYKSYYEHCRRCDHRFKCVVKVNYNLLQKEPIRDGVVQVLIQAMVREKLIISTRDLLNFMNDLLLGGLGKEEVMKLTLKKDSLEKVIEQNAVLLPNILYEKVELSNIIRRISNIDPLSRVDKKMEAILLDYQLTKDFEQKLKNDLEDVDKMFSAYMIEQVSEAQVQGLSQGKLAETRYHFFRLYRRMAYLANSRQEDETYREYMADLYASNKKDKYLLKELFKEVRENFFRWDGSLEIKGIRISSSKRHPTLGIYEEMNIKPSVAHYEVLKEEALEKFITSIELSYTSDKGKNVLALNIDYALYTLMKEISKGYLPNRDEQNKNITFQLFIEKLLETNRNLKSDDEQNLIFEAIQSKEIKRYQLDLDEFGEYEFNRVM